ncbi:glycosyl hydrolase 53 family protein [Caldanaerobius polysaccharolyticus]|uniref:glycosyl hydrolase 53 family protein n=1 Tax=Caldanaerobius polysaccharolyticus TaxID=44256 RepID=UPI00047DFD39|nr:glycosyl hydrolase 53 family protein [Caldanaerobius polysaccharolyticus]
MTNKTKSFIVLAIVIVVIFFSVNVANANVQSTSSKIYVNPIRGLRSDFIKGADVSMLAQIEQNGGKFYDSGVRKDCLKILKDHGVNWIRLRIWNNPKDANGIWLGGGNNDEERTIYMAKRAKDLGLKILLDFHYSDFWADPGKQNKPAAWVNDSGEKLQQDVYDFTAKVIRDLKNNGVIPDMVQIGNEIDNGILWPDGKISGTGSGGYSGLAALLEQGIKAVRDNDPNKNDPEKKIKIMLHLSRGGDNALYRSFFDNLIYKQGLTDFDVIGLSYYPYWSGTLEELKYNINDISQRYNKYVVIAETAYAFTLDNADTTENNFGVKEEAIGGYKASVQGQATAVRNIMEVVSQVPDNKGLGVFYWEPDWIPVAGAGWKTDEGNAWENQAMFDFQGNALPSIDVFNLVSGAQGSVAPRILSIEPVNVSTEVGQAPTLPTTVNLVYDDESVRQASVTWESIDPDKYARPGSFTVTGTIPGVKFKAIATITVTNIINYVQNSGFEEGSLSHWNISGDISSVKIDKNAANAHSGSYSLNYWNDSAFTVTISQTITGLKNGYYKLSAYVDGSGGENSLQLFASDYGGPRLTADIHNSGWLVWQHPVISLIEVTNGQITIGLTIDGNSGNWGNLDDVQLIQVDASGSPIGGSVSTVLTTPSYVNSGDSFEIGYGLKDVSQAVYAQEITLSYDPMIFDFVKAVKSDDDTVISRIYSDTPGTVIIDTVNSKGLTVGKNLFNLTFRANTVDQLTYSNIAVTEAKLQITTKGGTTVDAALTSRTIAVGGTASVTLTSPTLVEPGNNFTLKIGISGILQPIYAQDITLNYDPNLFELLKIDSDGKSIVIDNVYDNIQGTARIIGINIGGLTGNSSVMKLTFRAKEVSQPANGVIFVADAQLGVAPQGNVIFPNLSSVNIKVESKGWIDNEGAATKSQGSTSNFNSIDSWKIIVTPVIDPITGIPTVNISVSDLNNALKNAPIDKYNVKTAVIDVPKIDGQTQYDIKLPASVFSSKIEKQKVEIATDVATITIPINMFSSAEVKGAKDIILSIKNVDKTKFDASVMTQIGTRPVIDLSVKVDSANILWNNPDAPVAISIPYKPTAEELKDQDHIVALYINDNEKAIAVPNSKYDPVSGKLIFTATHLGKYAVAFIHKTFNDISNYDWAKNAIEVLASKGITSGTSQTTFSPARKVSRAEYLSMLISALGLTAKVDENFDDVHKTDYYYESVGIAKKLGIVTGVGNKKFDPTEPITREDMMVLTFRALKAIGKLQSTGTTDDLVNFTDKNYISEYAEESIATLVKEGIVCGRANRIAPKDNATRAEAATIIYRVIKK